MPAPPPPVAHRFTHANARQMAAKSRDARAKRLADLRSAAFPTCPPPAGLDAYPSARLARVRVMLDRIDERLQLATDPLDLDRLARAAASLQEQERILAGRPLPGNLRPSSPRVPRASSASPQPYTPAVLHEPISPDAPHSSSTAPTPGATSQHSPPAHSPIVPLD